MKFRTLLALVFLLAMLTPTTSSAEEEAVISYLYLPIVITEQSYIIDCMDGQGNFIPCEQQHE